jgi:hypothetical protein
MTIINVSGENSVIDLSLEDLTSVGVLRLCNESANPATQIFLNLPALANNSDKLLWQSKVELQGATSDLIVLFKNSTHILNGDFDSFDNVLLSDHRILEKTNQHVILDPENHYPDIKLMIDKFKTKSGYIFCSHLDLLKGGRIREFLGIRNSTPDPRINFTVDGSGYEQFIIKELELASPIERLLLDHVDVTSEFKLPKVNRLLMKGCNTLQNSEYQNVGQIENLELNTAGLLAKVRADSVRIGKLIGDRGKFYIAAKSYIDFKLSDSGDLKGIDLVLDMKDSALQGKKVTFPGKAFHFDLVRIIGADEVQVPLGGVCRTMQLLNCSSVVASCLEVEEITYQIPDKPLGRLTLTQVKAICLLVEGKVAANLRDLKAELVEGKGLCNITVYGNSKITALRNNLDLDASNKAGLIKEQQAVVYLENSPGEKIFIKQILAKLSTFHIKGDMEIGNVVIQTIKDIHTHLWVQLVSHGRLRLDSLMVSHDHGFMVNKHTGEIIIQRVGNMISYGDVNAQVSSATVNDWLFVKAGNGIRFDGQVRIIQGDFGLFAGMGDISINGHVASSNAIVLSSQYGQISTHHSNLESGSIVLHAGGSVYSYDSVLKATEQMVIYSLGKYIALEASDFTAPNIALISKGDIGINNSKINSNLLVACAGANIRIGNSDVISSQLFLQSTYDFILAKSGINLKQHNHHLFVCSNSAHDNFLKGGISVIDDVTVIGIFTPQAGNLQRKFNWQMVDFATNVELEPGSAYIDAGRGYIIGSQISASSSVIIKTRESLEVVPLVLYNETISAGGFNQQAIREVVSKINAGLIDIDAGKAATFIGSLLTAAVGSVRAEDLLLLASPEEIQKQQERINILKQWGTRGNEANAKFSVGQYFNFSESTSISKRIGNLTVYDDYASRDLSFTQEGGDLVIDRSITKYQKLHLNAKGGKLLIVSKNLQEIYVGHGGGNSGKQAADGNRVVVGGDQVFLEADVVEIGGAKVKAVGEVRIVTKNGVTLLPISVHQRLMYHVGSKTHVDEYIVRQVISEIDAGYLDIKAGGAVKAVSALLNVTGLNIEASSLLLSGEREIFEKQVHFRGKKKAWGGRNSSHELNHDEFIVPTIINTENAVVEITGDTTFEAARILCSGDSVITSGGDINFLPKYDIHIHDYAAKKATFLSFHKGIKVGCTKSIKEHYHGQTPAPTIYYSDGQFFGYSDGSIHLLGAKLIGNDIYLAAKKGIKLEAAKFTEEQFIAISEKGMRIGYSSSGGSHSFSAELFNNQSSARYHRTLYEVAEIIADNNLIINSQDGALEVISSKLRFEKARFSVKDFKVSTYQEELLVTSSQSSQSVGLHIGVQEKISGTVKHVGQLLEKRGTHWLDMLDGALKAYQVKGELTDLGKDIINLCDSPKAVQNLATVKIGAWASASASFNQNQQVLKQAIDTIIRGGNLEIIASNAADIEGIDCIVDNFKLKASSLKVRASENSASQKTFSAAVSLNIPIKGNIPVSADGSISSSSYRETSYNPDNKIQAFGTMEIEVDGDGKISGVTLLAEKVYIKAQNLVLESLQDIIEQKMQSMSMSISFSPGTNSISGSPHIGGQERNAAWTRAVGQIIGSQLVDIVVQQTLEISGGLIANAEVDASGNLTDKGNLRVKAAAVIAKKLHDYDNGQSYGIGFSLSKNLSSGKIGVGAPVAYSFSDNERDILPTIGTCADIITSAIPGLNRSLNSHIGSTSSDKASLDSVIPVSDICEFLQDKIAPTPDFKQLIQKDRNPDTDFDMLSNISEEALSAYGDLSSDELENLIKAAYNLYEFYKANPDKLKQDGGSLIQTCLAQGFTILHGRATNPEPEPTGVAAGGSDLGLIAAVGDFLGQLGEQIVDIFSLKTEQEQIGFEEQKAKQQIDEWLNKKPNNLTGEESQKFAKIKSEVDDRYENLPSATRLELTIRAYNLNNKLESMPDLVIEGTNYAMGIPVTIAPPPYAANTEELTSDAPLISVPSSITKSIDVAREYYQGGDLTRMLIIARALGIIDYNKVYEPPIKKSLTTTSGDGDYNYDSFEKRKHDPNHDNKQKVSSFKDSAISPSPQFDPDDEDNHQDCFDPSKQGNHDKVKRDARFGKLYRDAQDSRIWYSKERSGDRAHGGEHWKKFIKEGDWLVHDADIDMAGKIMDKHKSAVGIRIKFKDLMGIK